MDFSSRKWLAAIAEDYGQRMGLGDTVARRHAVEAAVQSALVLLRMPPWHMRILIGGVETAASLWCLIYGLFRLGRATWTEEIEAFAKMPVISTPLLRLYRSLVAIGWYEQPIVLQAYGIAETPEEKQERFRGIRNKAA